MKIDRISYQKVFPLGLYINERIGVEVQLDEGDSPEDALLHAKDMVEGFHREQNPHLYEKKTIDTPHSVEPFVAIEKPEESPEFKRWDTIAAGCTSEKELGKWVAKCPPEYQHLLEERRLQIVNRKTVYQ